MTISPTAQAPLSPEFRVSEGGGTSETKQYEGFSPSSTLPPGTKPVQSPEANIVEFKKAEPQEKKGEITGGSILKGLASLLLPGTGQFFNGETGKGFLHLTTAILASTGTILLIGRNFSNVEAKWGGAIVGWLIGAFSAGDAVVNSKTNE